MVNRDRLSVHSVTAKVSCGRTLVAVVVKRTRSMQDFNTLERTPADARKNTEQPAVNGMTRTPAAPETLDMSAVSESPGVQCAAAS